MNRAIHVVGAIALAGAGVSVAAAAGAVAAAVLVAAKRAFGGFGGKFGTIAFAACPVTAGLLSLGRVLAPVGSDAVTG